VSSFSAPSVTAHSGYTAEAAGEPGHAPVDWPRPETVRDDRPSCASAPPRALSDVVIVEYARRSHMIEVENAMVPHVVDGSVACAMPVAAPMRPLPIEATVSETVLAHGLRHCRYRGLAKTHVQHVLTAAGTNIVRLSECFPPGTTPASPPRPPSHFRQLCGRLTA
jgi:hypothetical protein